MITKAAHVRRSTATERALDEASLFILPFHRRVCGLQFIHCTYHHRLPSFSSSRQEPNSRNNDRFASIDRGDRGERAARRQGHHEALARGRAIWGSLRRGYADPRATGPARRPDRGGRPDRRRRRGERRATHSGQAPPERIRKFIHWPRAGRGVCCGACRRSGPIPMAPFPPDLTSCLPHLARASG